MSLASLYARRRACLFALTALAVALPAVLAGCANQPPPPAHPGPYNSPLDAMEATPVPYDPSTSDDSSNQSLSRDLSQLRDARQNYEHSQAEARYNLQQEQANCRQTPGARLVHINDGSGDPNAVYCELPPSDNQSDDSGP